MAHHKDAIKRIKQNASRRMRNRHYRSTMRNHIKVLRTAIDEGDKEQAQSLLRETESVIHRLAGKGIIHRNQAGRRISRLVQAVKAMDAAS